MKDAFAKGFEECLRRMKWPAKDIRLAYEEEQRFAEGVEKLLELQEPYVFQSPYNDIIQYGFLISDRYFLVWFTSRIPHC